MTRSLIFALALCAGVLGGSPAIAVAGDVQVAKVHYADLDLGSQAGKRVLGKRIERALRHVCDYNPQERQYALKAKAARCIAETRTTIVLPEKVAARLAVR